MKTIPEQLREFPLIRVCRPNCRTHDNCSDSGKRPVSSTKNPRPIGEIRNWIRTGGNYGVVPRSDNYLIVLDSDSDLFTEIAAELPETFTIRTGSGNYHFYFKSEYTGNQSFKIDGTEFGSIRTSNWHTVGPGSVHPDTGEKYRVSINARIAALTEPKVENFIDTLKSRIDREDGGGGGGGGGGSAGLHGRKASELDVQPSEETLRVLQFINSEEYRENVAKVLDASHPPRQTRVWACGFLHSACGLTQGQLEKLLREVPEWASDSNRVETEVRSLVRSSVNNGRASESVSLDEYLHPGDMEGDTSESRKTESGSEGTGLKGGENMPEFTDKEAVKVKEGSDDGDRAIEAARVKGRDGDDSFEFVSLRKGRVKTVELTNGEEGQIIDVDDTGKSVGGTADLDLVIEALQELNEEIN